MLYGYRDMDLIRTLEVNSTVVKMRPGSSDNWLKWIFKRPKKEFDDLVYPWYSNYFSTNGYAYNHFEKSTVLKDAHRL